jgi:DNA-binding XRE family transcriptional regulator
MALRDDSQKKPPAAVRRALADGSRNLGAWRKLRGLTQAQLADRAGVSVSTLRHLEGGDGGVFSRALAPYESDIGRLRSDERLPGRVDPRKLG